MVNSPFRSIAGAAEIPAIGGFSFIGYIGFLTSAIGGLVFRIPSVAFSYVRGLCFTDPLDALIVASAIDHKRMNESFTPSPELAYWINQQSTNDKSSVNRILSLSIIGRSTIGKPCQTCSPLGVWVVRPQSEGVSFNFLQRNKFRINNQLAVIQTDYADSG